MIQKGVRNHFDDLTTAERSMLERRQVLVGLPIDDSCSTATIAKLLFLQQLNAKEAIALYINSPGGSIPASLAILDTMQFLNPPVHTFGLSRVNGTALWLLAAGERGHRHVQRGASLSIEPSRVDSLLNQDKVARLKAVNATLTRWLESCSSLTDGEIQEALEQGRSFTCEQAIAAGMADFIFDLKPSPG